VAGDGANVPAIQIEMRPLSIEYAVARLEADRGQRGVGGRRQPHLAFDLQIEHGPERVRQPHRLAQQREIAARIGQRKRFGVDRRGRLPVRQILRHARREEQSERSALRPQPEAILAAVDVHVRRQLTRRDQRAVQPAEARAFVAGGGAGGDAPLQRRAQRHARATPIRQHHRLRVALQEAHIVAKATGRAHGRSSLSRSGSESS